MARKPAQTYDVVRAQDGALVVPGVPLATARVEVARLNAEAKVRVGTMLAVHDAVGNQIQPEVPLYGSMFHGEITRYEVRSADGLVIA